MLIVWTTHRFSTVTVSLYPTVFCDHIQTESKLFYYAILNETIYGYCKVSETIFFYCNYRNGSETQYWCTLPEIKSWTQFLYACVTVYIIEF
jgi:hypothetical protein